MVGIKIKEQLSFSHIIMTSPRDSKSAATFIGTSIRARKKEKEIGKNQAFVHTQLLVGECPFYGHDHEVARLHIEKEGGGGGGVCAHYPRL